MSFPLYSPWFQDSGDTRTSKETFDDEPDWVTFPCSPFGDNVPFDEIPTTKATPKKVVSGATTSTYQQHVASVEMIYGRPVTTSQSTPIKGSVPRELSPTSTIIHVPPMQEIQLNKTQPVRHDQKRQVNRNDNNKALPPNPPAATSSVTTTPVFTFARRGSERSQATPVIQNKHVNKDVEKGAGTNTPCFSLDPTESPKSVDEFEDEPYLDHPKKKPFHERIPWAIGSGVVCVSATVFLIIFFGLILATAMRGESVTLQNVFSTGSRNTPPVPLVLGVTTSPSISPTTSLVPSAAPTLSPTFVGPPPSNITVGAYYYPWHGNDFHKGQGYLRKELNQFPMLGEYNDTDKQVIAQHLSWSRRANIRLWITSWWGPDRLEDSTTRDLILNHRDLGDLEIVLLYETAGRIREDNDFDTVNVESDIEYICQTYFDHPNYYRINDQPVLFVYVTRVLATTGKMEEVILLMRSVAEFWGYTLYLVGDHVFGDAPVSQETYRPFLYLDAVTNYDVYGSMGTPGFAGQEGVDAYYQDQRQWRQEAHLKKCGFIPAVSPGYNDRGVRLEADHAPLSRQLTSESPEGSLFEASLRHARYLVDEAVGNLLVVNSFNEWHEDTQIEPAVGMTTNEPFNLTAGLSYPGYGELYLDLLRKATADGFEADQFWASTSAPVVAPEGNFT